MILACGQLGCENLRPSLAPINMQRNSIVDSFQREKQLTRNPGGHILTNVGVWSPDGVWVVYDTRSDPAGDVFDGSTIEMVNVQTEEVKALYESRNGAHCGVATFSPVASRVVFIQGPERPTPDWQYGPTHRQGLIVDAAHPGQAGNLEARDLTPPFTPGALRGGSHVHVFSGDGAWVSFTYEDHVLSAFQTETPDHEINLRNIGVSVPFGPVPVKKSHSRNHDGKFFSVLVTRAKAHPKPGSDEITKAFEEGWVGTNGYARPDGRRQQRALAFQGQVLTPRGEAISEVFIVDLNQDLTIPGEGPLAGTEKRRPSPPKGTAQRRLTFTAERRYPGLQGPRHWLRSSPDGSRIAFLMKDDAGIVQLWTVSPNGGAPVQMTRNALSIASAFTWSPDGLAIGHVIDNSLGLTNARTGRTTRLTPRSEEARGPRPEACVFSPDGGKIAFVRRLASGEREYNQICAVFF